MADLKSRKGKAGSPTSAPEADQAASPPAEKKKSDLVVRGVWTLIMFAGLLVLLYYGQTALIGLVCLCQIAMFREVSRIGQNYKSDKSLPGFQLLPWYFLGVSLIFLYLRALRKPLLETYPELEEPIKSYSFVCFCLYIVGFMAFVLTLKKGHLPYQFGQFAWTHMTIFYIVIQGITFVYNMFEGIIWFLLPAMLIISNDCWAYICGRAFGRHSLIKLSPKKTVEGFVGAAICTFVTGFFLSEFLSRYSFLVCPKLNFHEYPDCEIPSTFIPTTYTIPDVITAKLGLPDLSFTVKPIMLQSIAFSLFASIAAPFGGFFGSGLKRAFGIKDFGHLIPGHGGVTDRMDCQLLMGTFTYVFISNFIRPSGGFCSSFSLLIHCARRLPIKEQIRLYNAMASQLAGDPAVAILPNGTAALA